jgi:hypothetical protein
MAAVEEFEITIDAKGKVHLSVRGVPGETCLEISAELEALLGNMLEDRHLTAEYYEKPLTAPVRELKLKSMGKS